MTASARTTTASLTRKPLDDEIDVYGLTHPGKVRTSNQDQFLLASLQKRIQVHGTSLPEVAQLKREEERVAFLAVVAQGAPVGGKGTRPAARFSCVSSGKLVP